MNRLPFLILLFVLTFSACAPRPQDCARPDVFCVGLVTDFGSVNSGINQEAWLGLQDAKADEKIDRADLIETIDARDRAKNIKTFAENGYDVIITVGASISDETVTAAQKYPHILFIGVEQPQNTKYPNLAGLVFHEDQSGFLAGALAALITKTNRIAGMCEEKFIDPMRRYCDGFQAGALYVKKDVKVTVVYRNGSEEDLFNDVNWGQTTAQKLVHDGVDVLFAAGGGTADAALEAAANEGASVIGAETDNYARLADVRPRLVTSAINDVRSGVQELMRLAREGQFPSGESMGQVNLAPFHEFEIRISSDVATRLEEIRTGLANGSIKTGILYKSP
ncbi:MAG: BMP family ABC transporter substrate-binding protein [Chloroflexi bacterium]|nr:BMP family ABC transporter substrate-binding protein [Chloroflexota bacterium]